MRANLIETLGGHLPIQLFLSKFQSNLRLYCDAPKVQTTVPHSKSHLGLK